MKSTSAKFKLNSDYFVKNNICDYVFQCFLVFSSIELAIIVFGTNRKYTVPQTCKVFYCKKYIYRIMNPNPPTTETFYIHNLNDFISQWSIKWNYMDSIRLILSVDPDPNWMLIRLCWFLTKKFKKLYQIRSHSWAIVTIVDQHTTHIKWIQIVKRNHF